VESGFFRSLKAVPFKVLSSHTRSKALINFPRTARLRSCPDTEHQSGVYPKRGHFRGLMGSYGAKTSRLETAAVPTSNLIPVGGTLVEVIFVKKASRSANFGNL